MSTPRLLRREGRRGGAVWRSGVEERRGGGGVGGRRESRTGGRPRAMEGVAMEGAAMEGAAAEGAAAGAELCEELSTQQECQMSTRWSYDSVSISGAR